MPDISDAPEFDSGFITLLAELNARIASVGERVEGSCFYGPGDFPPPQIHPGMRTRRQSLIAAARGKQRFLEIGVNAGHSALLLLYHHPELIYHGVDICAHRYTQTAVDFLKWQFNERVIFYPGDSRRVLPALVNSPMRFELMHIDGGHAVPVFEADFHHCLKLADDPAWIIADDTKAFDGALGSSLRELVAKGLAVYDTCEGWNSPGSELVRVVGL